MARREPRFWSPCCGQLVEYTGYYRCSSCKERVEFGALARVGEREAARIRAGLASPRTEGDPGPLVPVTWDRPPAPGDTRPSEPRPAPASSPFDDAHVRFARRPARQRAAPPPGQLALFTADEVS